MFIALALVIAIVVIGTIISLAFPRLRGPGKLLLCLQLTEYNIIIAFWLTNNETNDTIAVRLPIE